MWLRPVRYLRGVVLRKLVILGAVAAALPAAALAGGPETLMPGVTYEDGVQFTPHGAVVLHVIRAPRPGGLYRVEPTLAQGTILGRETVTGMQERLAGSATIASVNGDLFDARDGHPSGIVLRGGVLDHPPFTGRSSGGFDAQGLLHVDRVRFFGTWKGAGQRRPLAGVDQVPTPGEVVLFTPAWGVRTPPLADAVDVVLPSFPPARPDGDLTGTVAQVVRGGGTPIPPGGAVLQARGNLIGQKMLAEVRPAASITARLILQPDWAGIQDAIGGGPLLVRDGKAVFRANEAFAAAQLQPRAPRAAVGQAADGSVLLVTVDGGRAGGSVGMTSFELALALQRLGAVRAMALGSGAPTTMAFDGTLLNRPAGAEQPVGDALSIV